MNAFFLVLAASPLLLLVVVVILVVIVTGIRRADRGDLRSSHNRVNGITRRMTGLGIRSNSEDEGGES